MVDPEIDPLGNEIAGRAGMRPFSLSLPMRLLLAREAVMRQFRPLLAEYDLSEQQWRVIRALKEQQVMEAGVLAQSVFLLGPSLTRILQNLESRGLVQRRRQAQDQRKVDVSITPAGRRLFDEIAPRSEARYRQLEDRIGQADLTHLLDELAELVRRLEP
jgi:homoprotocatechuate degradation regulator HpaR